MWLESDAPATVESLGIGCATTSPNVRLAASAPAVGNPEFELQLLHAQPGTLALFGLAARRQTTLLACGCQLHLANPVTVIGAIVGVDGTATIDTALPSTPLLRGLDVFVQAATSDFPNSCLGVALTNGLRLRFGD